MNWSGKRVVILGGSSGIGKEIARQVVPHGSARRRALRERRSH